MYPSKLHLTPPLDNVKSVSVPRATANVLICTCVITPFDRVIPSPDDVADTAASVDFSMILLSNSNKLFSTIIALYFHVPVYSLFGSNCLFTDATTAPIGYIQSIRLLITPQK